MPDESHSEAQAPTPTPQEASPAVLEQVATHHLEAGHHHGPAHLPRLKFIEEIKRRNVGRVGILYIGVSYVVLEIFEMFFHLLELPPWTGRAVVLLAVIGFPIALLLAWAYEVTPEGLKPVGEVPPQGFVASQTGKRLDRAIIVVLAVALCYFVFDKFWLSRRGASMSVQDTDMHGTSPSAFNPPPHSIAVLPFANMSADKDQEYFTDGLTEELLNSLTSITELQVAARTSAFSFKGTNTDIGTIARKLNVGAVLEGSVRRSEHTIRITAQLINTVTGFHLWSQTYDRDMKDVLKLQTDIATEVSRALVAKLLGKSDGARILGGTDNANAFDAYLRGENLLQGNFSEAGYSDADSQQALAAYDEAIRLDPHFANAFVGKARVLDLIAGAGVGGNIQRTAEEARAAAESAIDIAPSLGIAHAELAWILGHGLLDYRAATPEIERAMTLSPGDDRVVSISAILLSYMGKADESIAQAKRSVVLDPLNRSSHIALGTAYFSARRFQDAIEAYKRALTIDPGDYHVAGRIGYAYDALGDYASAIKSCTTKQINYIIDVCLAIAYDQAHRRADSDAQIARFMARTGDSGAYQYTEIYAQRGDVSRALTWLETAERVGDTGLHFMRVDPFVDPLRTEHRFQVIESKLNFPD